ncbi:LptF/LptG family permease [Swaminathania salitolerans]|uniref:LPS export ABC transporter permease LptG n=1 Tax=Swaminathania salitolerans TaxID=182838 RepID=A0A511BS12_9PROT|nr:LptF/LptG family permease [Swaminathania salitolerans]GBQ12551.1 transporter YjgP/YjgQ [Swaminathania salitolerans LMG 21291]GEL03090.1 LPS export ABC transporter permease LptG [Swaminathania salitolerans]
MISGLRGIVPKKAPGRGNSGGDSGGGPGGSFGGSFGGNYGGGVLVRHLTRSLLSRTALCGAILIGLLEILGLLEVTTPILERHLGLGGIVHYALLRLPALSVQTLPLSTLIGALFMLMQMTLNSEMASLRAAGLSTRRLVILLLPAIAAISAFGIGMQEFVAPRSEIALTSWWNRTDPDPATGGRALWFHAAGDVVHIDGFSKGGARLLKPALYHRAPNGDLISADTAPDAVYDPVAGWQAATTRTLTRLSDKVLIGTRTDVILLPPSITPETIIQLSQPYPALSSWSIWKILHRGGASSLPKATYRMALFAPFVLPVSLCAMLLLALPVIYIPPRAGTKSLLPIAALAAGFGFIVLQGLIQALGNAGTLPAPVAMAAPPILAFLLGGAWIVKMEET